MEKKKCILLRREFYDNKDLRLKTKVVVTITESGDAIADEQVAKWSGPWKNYDVNKVISSCNCKEIKRAILNCKYPHIKIEISNKLGAIADYDYLFD